MIYVISEQMGSWGSGIVLHLLKLAFGEAEFTNDVEKAQLIVRSCGGEPTQSRKLPYIVFMGESYDLPNINEKLYSPLFKILAYKDYTHPLYFNVPYLVSVYFELETLLGKTFNLDDLRLDTSQDRPYLLAYCASNPKPHRDHLFRLIQSKDSTAHGIGLCCSTPGFTVGEHATWRENWQHYRKYRFTLAMENVAKEGYVTEKLLNAILAGSIPIYYGDPAWVKKVFNEKAIIFVQDFPSLEECAKYVVNVDRNKQMLARYQNQPIFVKEKKWFTSNKDEIHPDYSKMINIIKSAI